MVFFVCLLALCYVCMFVFVCTTEVKFGHIVIIALCSIFAFVSIQAMVDIEYPKPTAMDVYRGNTTLEVTYRDSVAIDSTVVFKNYDIDGR